MLRKRMPFVPSTAITNVCAAGLSIGRRYRVASRSLFQMCTLKGMDSTGRQCAKVALRGVVGCACWA